MIHVKPYQINMAVFCWYLVNSDLSNVGHWTSIFFLQNTRNTRPCWLWKKKVNLCKTTLPIYISGFVGFYRANHRLLRGQPGKNQQKHKEKLRKISVKKYFLSWLWDSQKVVIFLVARPQRPLAPPPLLGLVAIV